LRALRETRRVAGSMEMYGNVIMFRGLADLPSLEKRAQSVVSRDREI
jgi:hypothetical protein